MTKRILCYGDSNTWGTPDVSPSLRYEHRWPRAMAAAISDIEIDLIEDAIPGRTIALDDHDMAETRFLGDPTVANGYRHILASLRAHSPLDLVILMLGTNDLKGRFSQTPFSIASNIERMARRILTSKSGPGPWSEGSAPKLLILCPAQVGARIQDPEYDRKSEWGNAQAVMAELPGLYHQVASQVGAEFYDVGPVVTPGAHDPFHWPEAEHIKLGQELAPLVQGILTRDSL